MTAPTPDPTLADTDEPVFAHVIRSDDLDRAVTDGGTVTALCGKTWRPSLDVGGRPVCHTCADVLNNLRVGRQGLN